MDSDYLVSVGGLPVDIRLIFFSPNPSQWLTEATTQELIAIEELWQHLNPYPGVRPISKPMPVVLSTLPHTKCGVFEYCTQSAKMAKTKWKFLQLQAASGSATARRLVDGTTTITLSDADYRDMFSRDSTRYLVQTYHPLASAKERGSAAQLVYADYKPKGAEGLDSVQYQPWATVQLSTDDRIAYAIAMPSQSDNEIQLPAIKRGTGCIPFPLHHRLLSAPPSVPTDGKPMVLPATDAMMARVELPLVQMIELELCSRPFSLWESCGEALLTDVIDPNAILTQDQLLVVVNPTHKMGQHLYEMKGVASDQDPDIMVLKVKQLTGYAYDPSDRIFKLKSIGVGLIGNAYLVAPDQPFLLSKNERRTRIDFVEITAQAKVTNAWDYLSKHYTQPSAHVVRNVAAAAPDWLQHLKTYGLKSVMHTQLQLAVGKNTLGVQIEVDRPPNLEEVQGMQHVLNCLARGASLDKFFTDASTARQYFGQRFSTAPGLHLIQITANEQVGWLVRWMPMHMRWLAVPDTGSHAYSLHTLELLYFVLFEWKVFRAYACRLDSTAAAPQLLVPACPQESTAAPTQDEQKHSISLPTPPAATSTADQLPHPMSDERRDTAKEMDTAAVAAAAAALPIRVRRIPENSTLLRKK